MKRFVVASIWVVALGCSAEADYPNTTSNKPDGGLALAQEKLDPMKAQARVGTAGQVAASEGSTFQVPGFSLSLTGANYAEIIRCAKSFAPIASNGMDARQIPANHPLRWEEMRSAFEEAKSDRNNCRIVGNRVVKAQIQDLAAPTGEWYYIINPCVEKENSTRIDRFCSYELQFTDAVTYTSLASEAFIAATEEAATAEAILSATFSRLYRHAELMQRWKEGCDQSYFAAIKQKRIIAGLVNIVTTGLSVGAGAVFGGVGGMVAQTFLGALRDMFSALPDPKWQCPKFDMEQKQGAETYKLVEPQLKAVVDARAKLNTLNAAYAKLDASIMESVRSNSE